MTLLTLPEAARRLKRDAMELGLALSIRRLWADSGCVAEESLEVLLRLERSQGPGSAATEYGESERDGDHAPVRPDDVGARDGMARLLLDRFLRRAWVSPKLVDEASALRGFATSDQGTARDLVEGLVACGWLIEGHVGHSIAMGLDRSHIGEIEAFIGGTGSLPTTLESWRRQS